VIWYAFSSIYGGPLNGGLCLFHNVALVTPNKITCGVADVEREYGGGLPLLNRLVRKIRQDYDKKLDMYRRP
jgi:hypothetical protein